MCAHVIFEYAYTKQAHTKYVPVAYLKFLFK